MCQSFIPFLINEKGIKTAVDIDKGKYFYVTMSKKNFILDYNLSIKFIINEGSVCLKIIGVNHI